ncbi:hypothetical protein MKW98_007031 [Papaver atlanticum]|uniref:Thiaminase-2/PQQC domain-containing protein n=1 Tax=Papaver atlanticum TaxID=357466 RepID=A0AAD4STC3_9MAGN|nr:hypothetical protein MKW98_007031 [Papaver atlanticum]
MALVQESSSEEVVEINSMSTSKEVEEMSESDSDEISMSELLWTSCRNETLYLIYSPLFVHIASGSLDDKEFDQYVADYAYLLKDFVEVWSSNVKQELGRNNSLVGQKLCLNPTKETTLHPATAKYKELLLATASGNIQVSEIPIQQSKIPSYTLGAVMPSLRLYAFLSEAMQKLVSPYVYSHPYSKWLKEYSYESFERSYLDSEEVLDELCDSLTEKEVEVVERLYYQAMALQMDFFYSRHVASLEILANIEILTAQKPDQQLQGEDRERHSQITSIDLRKTWELLSQQYTWENNNFVEKIMLGKKAVSFDYEGLYSALVKLSSSEEQAVSRIFDSGVLKGISLEDIKQKVNNLDASVIVMSCWSGDLTRSALSGGLDMLKVDGNEFSYGDGIFTGEVTRQAHQSVTAKLKYFEDMVQENASEHGVGSRTVFVGGSVSDLLCLLTADIGIVIGSNKSLIKVGKHFGITFVPLCAGVVKEQKKRFKIGNPIVWTGGLSGTLYTVTSWIEIHAFILGCDLVNEEL